MDEATRVRRALDEALEAAEHLCAALHNLRPDAIVEAAHGQARAVEVLEALGPGAVHRLPGGRARAARLRALAEQQLRLRRRAEAILRRLRALEPGGVEIYGPPLGPRLPASPWPIHSRRA